MPAQISGEQFNEIKLLVTQGNVSAFYQSLASKGYQYAGLAQQIVDVSLTGGGVTALGFMQLTAQRLGVALSAQQVAAIELNLANEYIGILRSQLDTQGFINRDVTAQQTWDMHSIVFPRFGLPPDAWSLNTPFKVIFGDNSIARENYFQDILSSSTAGRIAILQSTTHLIARISRRGGRSD